MRKTEEGIWVNLAFNHESPEARVVSFLPNEGRVTVVARYPRRLPPTHPWFCSLELRARFPRSDRFPASRFDFERVNTSCSRMP